MIYKNLKSEKKFRKPYKDVFNAMTSVLEGNDFYIACAEMSREIIKAHSNIRFFSWGEDVEITFKKGRDLKVEIKYGECKSFLRKLAIKREANKLLEKVEQEIDANKACSLHQYN